MEIFILFQMNQFEPVVMNGTHFMDANKECNAQQCH